MVGYKGGLIAYSDLFQATFGWTEMVNVSGGGSGCTYNLNI